ncbi:MAG: putative nicotinate-nucleotide adenylyltransferase [Candidatus Falkowbacteria bacterium GW2011_GWC2_38_22]|uniref:nicotinate-nucleotide adenylyltransferase n=1 Tax=Candidatus Falkowbacteria bacterium GW2011_GWE1_38_31 TaxID=1618638 RepID=A0A0G0K582_9BACT|nr:MAG: putative nicotinate-nucleotide adenylyltransferase [Candidatus Falkowbacteria bacterium GW2011_GWF2_38_1205]KKQ61663.1 MAG: putative nicotinate-nucleotide adenylyltransferase [Candidatus Falkowbacteria bacterium GW2011_GWC2_38_22]KKQ63722.1 MAG: putative nicotinate-nucleotide adenylyltransferase [Candidatus Falkowbacteria bacterium GW2011_GWF1_38_22]KKQ65862.1 MAG: putative nicotinate-nucleotide adenylyltransferase [Candidatus Falkowbacteria bacterium GW2011_GWE2_38_254]KKQ70585.1 MAG: 
MLQGIILVGGSFDPPGNHHVQVLERICNRFNNARIIVVPCGPRKDKPSQGTTLDQRIEMVYSAFGQLEEDGLIEIDVYDLEKNCFRPTHVLGDIYSKQGKVLHFVGAEIIAGGAKGSSYIHKHWARKETDYNQLHFLVGGRPCKEYEPDDLPFGSVYLPLEGIFGSSTEIRRRIKAGDESFCDMVCEDVARVIVWDKLYGWKGYEWKS